MKKITTYEEAIAYIADSLRVETTDEWRTKTIEWVIRREALGDMPILNALSYPLVISYLMQGDSVEEAVQNSKLIVAKYVTDHPEYQTRGLALGHPPSNIMESGVNIPNEQEIIDSANNMAKYFDLIYGDSLERMNKVFGLDERMRAIAAVFGGYDTVDTFLKGIGFVATSMIAESYFKQVGYDDRLNHAHALNNLIDMIVNSIVDADGYESMERALELSVTTDLVNGIEIAMLSKFDDVCRAYHQSVWMGKVETDVMERVGKHLDSFVFGIEDGDGLEFITRMAQGFHDTPKDDESAKKWLDNDRASETASAFLNGFLVGFLVCALIVFIASFPWKRE